MDEKKPGGVIGTQSESSRCEPLIGLEQKKVFVYVLMTPSHYLLPPKKTNKIKKKNEKAFRVSKVSESRWNGLIKNCKDHNPDNSQEHSNPDPGKVPSVAAGLQ